MKILLHGDAQFIVTSISFLVASYQANYVNRLKEILRSKKFTGTVLQWKRIHKTYRWLLCFWWLTVFSALLGGVRILLELKYFEHYALDLVIIVLMVAGYSCGAWVGRQSWGLTLRMPRRDEPAVEEGGTS